jgi:hypothetical protein
VVYAVFAEEELMRGAAEAFFTCTIRLTARGVSFESGVCGAKAME